MTWNCYEVTYTVSATRTAVVQSNTAINAERDLKENLHRYMRHGEAVDPVVTVDKVVLRVDVPNRV